jgi:hypothetical protein
MKDEINPQRKVGIRRPRAGVSMTYAPELATVHAAKRAAAFFADQQLLKM